MNKWHKFTTQMSEPFYPTLVLALRAYGKMNDKENYEIILDDGLYFIKEKKK